MNQYFHRMNIVAILSLLLPIVGFISAYTALIFVPPTRSFTVMFEWLAMVTIATWLVGSLIFFKRIKSLRNVQGLGLKLGKYFRLTTVRYFLFSALSIVLVALFFITGDDRVTGFFAANMIMSAIIWPFPSKVCRDLKLKGDEYEMVYFKKDTF